MCPVLDKTLVHRVRRLVFREEESEVSEVSRSAKVFDHMIMISCHSEVLMTTGSEKMTNTFTMYKI